jgi:hypothetical protein
MNFMPYKVTNIAVTEIRGYKITSHWIHCKVCHLKREFLTQFSLIEKWQYIRMIHLSDYVYI